MLDSQPDLSLLTDIRQKMQQVLSIVLSLLTVSDEVLLFVSSSSIDSSPSPSTSNPTEATKNDVKEVNCDENTAEDMEGLKGDESEDKFVFLADDVDRSWTEHFDVVEVIIIY